MRWFALVGALAAGLALAAVAPSARAAACADWPAWLAPGCETIADTWNNGRDGLLISGYAWHLPFSWTAERRRELNADAWGVGYYRTTEDAKGDSRSLFLAAFSDSHKHPQWNLGYEYSTYWGPRSGVQAGLGYTALIVQRRDIFNGFPFPAVLPLASLRYRDVTVFTTYIPTLNGGVNHGSTLFVFGRILLK